MLKFAGVLVAALTVLASVAASVGLARDTPSRSSGPFWRPKKGCCWATATCRSASIKRPTQIIWRFGKGDAWDRRLDRSDDAKPPHIREVAHGIEVEGWKCAPYGGPVEATRGTKDPKRMREICQSAPPSYVKRPYPCPKPVGELALHFPADLPGMTVRQRLSIEEAKLWIECSWPSGVKIRLESFIPPKPNVLVVRWKVENWNAADQDGLQTARLVLVVSLGRPAARRHSPRGFLPIAVTRAFIDMASPKVTPLAPPTTKRDGDLWGDRADVPAGPDLPQRVLVIGWSRLRRASASSRSTCGRCTRRGCT